MRTKTQISVLVPNRPGALRALIEKVGEMPCFYLPESDEGTFGPMRVVFDTEDEADAFARKLNDDFHVIKKSVLSIGPEEASEAFRMLYERDVNIRYVCKQNGEYIVYVAGGQIEGLIA